MAKKKIEKKHFPAKMHFLTGFFNHNMDIFQYLSKRTFVYV